MRKFALWLAGGVLALVLALAAATMLAVDDAPRVAPRSDVSVADVERAMALVRQQASHPAPPGQLRWVALSERDVDLWVGHAAQRWAGADARVRLQSGVLTVEASIALPWRRWANVELVLRQADGVPEVDRLRVGRLPLPPSLARPLADAVAARQGVPLDALMAAATVDRVTLASSQVVVSYRLGPETARRLRAALVAPADRQRLRAHAEHLATLSRTVAGREVSLAQLLPAMLAHAGERAAAGDLAAEHRAALLVLTLFANHRPWRLVGPDAERWPRPRPLVVTLLGRHDLALHFLVSAVVAAEAGTPLADAVGLWKELDDARRGGSGFSFADLAADRAGTRFGELAVREPQRLQSRIAAGAGESDFMPEARDLPESLAERDFVARFGGVGGAGYERQLAAIDARIDALPVHR